MKFGNLFTKNRLCGQSLKNYVVCTFNYNECLIKWLGIVSLTIFMSNKSEDSPCVHWILKLHMIRTHYRLMFMLYQGIIYYYYYYHYCLWSLVSTLPPKNIFCNKLLILTIIRRIKQIDSILIMEIRTSNKLRSIYILKTRLSTKSPLSVYQLI